MSKPVLSVNGLTKSFSYRQSKAGNSFFASLFKTEAVSRIAVHPLEFQVSTGEIVAFLGPNGAGKSTTIKMLTGILYPSGGDAAVLGVRPWEARTQLAYQIGTVFGQKSQLWYHLPPTETFELLAKIYELSAGQYKKRRDQLIERFDLGPFVNTPVRKLSLGERMRCEVAAALLHRPKVVFLDEPTIGLDVVVKEKIRDLILALNREEEVTLFITSHDAGDIEHLCKRAIFINEGRIVLDQPVSAVKRDYLQTKKINIQHKQLSPVQMTDMRHRLDTWQGLKVVGQQERQLALQIDTSVARLDEVLSFLVHQLGIEDVTIEDPSMEEIIKRIYASGRIEAEA